MIQLFVKFLPYLLLFYFFYRSVKEPLFLIGVPFLIFIRNSIFFDTIRYFQYPYDERADIFLTVWLMIFFAIFYYKSKQSYNDRIYNPININILDYCVFGLIIISGIGLGNVLSEYYIIDDVFIQFFILISLFLGYFIMKIIVKYTKNITLADFLFNIVIVNSIASCLFIIHQGLHFPIYKGQEFISEVFQGVLITRTFWFAPILWFFSISYLLVFKKLTSLPILGLFGVNFLALFLSYTRSTLIISIMLILLYYILTSIKNRDYSILARNIILGLVFGILFFQVVSYFLPANTNYFVSRFETIKPNPNEKQDNTLIQRFTNTSGIIGEISDSKLIFGFGPVTERQLPIVENMLTVTADMVWTGVIFRWGYVGLFLFSLLYIASAVKAFNLFMQNEGLLSDFGLLLLLTIISQIFDGFIGWTFLSPNRYALGLWYLGILSGLVYRKNKMILNAN